MTTYELCPLCGEEVELTADKLMKPMRKLFYYTFGEELNYENRDRN